jgi:hypothetical protein
MPDLGIRAWAIVIGALAFMTFATVIVTRIYNAGGDAREVKIDRANAKVNAAADAKEREFKACPMDKWDWEGNRCAP